MNTIENNVIQMIQLNQYKTNHLLHIFLTIFTLSAWVPFYFMIMAHNRTMRNKIKLAHKIPIENRFPIFLAWFVVCIYCFELIATIMVMTGQI